MIIKHIWNGWKNVWFPSDEAEELATKRMVICNKCDTKSPTGLFCSKRKGGCGCPLLASVRSVDYKCIKGKW